MGDSGKLRFYELDHESTLWLLKTHSRTSNGLAVEPGKREEKQLKVTQTLQQGKSHPPKPCRVPPVWRRGGGKKGSRTCRIPAGWRGGGQERLRGKPTTEKAPWQWRRTQALTQGRNHAKNLPRAIGVAEGLTNRRQIRGMEGSRIYSPARVGGV